jgi:hypothetical protein
MTDTYNVTITAQELCIIQDALNAYGRATYAPDQSITETFEMLSNDQEDYTIDEVRYLWRSLQSRYKKENEE